MHEEEDTVDMHDDDMSQGRAGNEQETHPLASRASCSIYSHHASWSCALKGTERLCPVTILASTLGVCQCADRRAQSCHSVSKNERLQNEGASGGTSILARCLDPLAKLV